MYIIIFIFLVLLVLTIIILFNKRNIKEQFITSGIEKYIDIIYYINLDKRIDRNTNLLKELDKINYPKEKIERISAIYDERGYLGCSKSHIIALQKFIESSHETCIILEDDFEFKVPPEEAIQMINNLFENKIDFDICMLSINPIDIKNTKYPFLNKVNSGQTTAGYIVSKKFAPILLNNFIEGSIKLEESYIEHHNKNYNGEFAIDQYWKNIQPQNNFYVFNPTIGKQSASFSDIQNGYVDYGI